MGSSSLCSHVLSTLSPPSGSMQKVGCPSYSMSWGYGHEVKHLVLVSDDLMNMSAQCRAALHQRCRLQYRVKEVKSSVVRVREGFLSALPVM